MEKEFHFWRGRGRLTWREESIGPTRSHSLESTFFLCGFLGSTLLIRSIVNYGLKKNFVPCKYIYF